MPYGIRYVSANSTPGGDGSTTGTAGATRAWTINECLTRLSGAVEHRILNDGVHTITGNITLSAGIHTGTGRIEILGYDSLSLTPIVPQYNISGRMITTGMPRIVVASGFNVTSSTPRLMTFNGLWISGFVNNTLLNFNGNAQGTVINNCFFMNAATGFVARTLALFNAMYTMNSEIISEGNMAINANGLASNVIYRCYVEGAQHGIANSRENVVVQNVVVARQGYGIFAGGATSAYQGWLALGNTIIAGSGAFGVNEVYSTASGTNFFCENLVITTGTFVDRTTTGGVRSTGTDVLSVFTYNNMAINALLPTGNNPVIGESIKLDNNRLSGVFNQFVNSGVYFPLASATGITRQAAFNNAIGAMPSLVSRYVPEIL
jgi:hypothetical protein